MKTSSVFKYCIVPFIIFCFLIIVPINTTDAQYSVPVKSGWNMIGGLCNGVVAEIVSTIPEEMEISNFFGFDDGYDIVNELQKGFGYWVKASQEGFIVFNCEGAWNCGDIVVDYYDNKKYNSVKIGDQCWLKENMNAGTRIDGSQQQTENDMIEKYCYDDNPANCEIYGGLYQWGEAMQYAISEKARGICPPGWHIPTFAEFQTLSSTVSGNGNALKAIGQGEGDGAGTNESGFSALLAGYRSTDDEFGYFIGLLYYACFWSSTEDTSLKTYGMLLYSPNSNINGDSYVINQGFSVRCLQD